MIKFFFHGNVKNFICLPKLRADKIKLEVNTSHLTLTIVCDDWLPSRLHFPFTHPNYLGSKLYHKIISPQMCSQYTMKIGS